MLFVKRHTPSCKSALESCHLGPNFLTNKQGLWNTEQVVVPCTFGPEDHNSISKFHGSRNPETQRVKAMGLGITAVHTGYAIKQPVPTGERSAILLSVGTDSGPREWDTLAEWALCVGDG